MHSTATHSYHVYIGCFAATKVDTVRMQRLQVWQHALSLLALANIHKQHLYLSHYIIGSLVSMQEPSCLVYTCALGTFACIVL
jgi:hypothetical protein